MSDTKEKIEVEIVGDAEDDDAPDEREKGKPDPLSEDAELAEYGENVRQRIAKETAKVHAAQRELAQTRERLDATSQIARRAIDENKLLKSERAQGDKTILDSLFDKVKGDVELAKAEFKTAHESGDAEKTAEAIANLSAASADLRRVELAKAGYRAPDTVQDEPDRVKPRAGDQPAPKPLPPKAAEWLAKNTWYGKDAEKTRLARAADVYVSALGFDPNSDDYYAEVDKMVAEKSGAPRGQDRDQRPQSTTPSGRSAAPAKPSGNGKVTLNPAEAAQAKRLGVSIEAYAAAKRAGDVVIE